MSEDYEIKMSYNNDAEKFILPINPEKIEIKENGKSNTFDIIGGSEINAIQSPKLIEISFESIFPYTWLPYVTVSKIDLFKPEEYVDRLRKWKNSKHPFRFSLTGPSSNFFLPMTIEKFEWKEVAGTLGDIHYRIVLKEYIFYAAKKIEVVQQDGQTVLIKQPAQRPDYRIRPKTYTLQLGDNLWKVAKKILGDGSRSREIQELNGVSTADLKRLPVGMVIKIPED
ncbi:LysM peptidoglycan-binding domain-containing protein [Chengkuizengella sp. SCS-71B]|uniref:LysM peptidoglycan-binding domain-containing protein n=1 Tax=Chengkuizengella sp. SCS-71B TaxID=3115290 RepID=UPI0032C20F1E